MNIFKLFKKQIETKKEDFVLQANATLYPDKILIETVDRVKEGFGISSTNISILPVNADNDTLASVLRHHLSLTKMGLTKPKDYEKCYQDYLDKAGFKNGKEHHLNALLLSIYQRDDKIAISPTKNGGHSGKERGFLAIKNADIIVQSSISNADLSDKIKEGWSKCQ